MTTNSSLITTMASFFIFLILINFVGLTIAQPVFLLTFCQKNIGNYTSNSIYEKNLKTLLFSLSTNIDTYGFYNASVGQNSDRVNAIMLSRGDVELNVCRTCVNDSAYNILQRCPNYKEAIGGYDYCILRYSNRSIFGTPQINPAALYPNDNYVSSPVQFNQALKNLLDNLRKRAASGDSRRKFATGNTSGPNFQTIYALSQCTPDLSKWQCKECLDGAAGQIPTCCDGKIGGRVIRPSCNLRFEINHFYNDTPSDALVTPQGKNNNTTRMVIIVVPSIVALVILIVCSLIFRRKRKHTKLKEEIETMDEISCIESLQHDCGTIKVATDNFSDSNKLGQGGFGAVYKGRLPNGKEIAVKRLSTSSGQGELEFKNEVLLVAKLQHRNLARLLGFCIEGIERLLLYEFVANASLDKFIFDPVKQAFLDWDRGYKIIEGVARGLLYLHEDSRLRIIHRDLKASNVLLDEEMNPKISDFGMAKLVVRDETHGDTSRIVGTYGYMAPEYAMHGKFSVKSDVFSFGVLVLEILSGQKNNNFRNGENVEDLLSYAWKNWQEGTTSRLIHPSLRASARSVQDMNRCIHIGLLCVQENVADRPTMASVVLMLSSFSLTLPVPSKPAFFMHGSNDPKAVMTESSQLESKSSHSSVNGTSITDLYPR